MSMNTQSTTPSPAEYIPFEIIAEILRNPPLDWTPVSPYFDSREQTWRERSHNWRENTRSLVSATHVCRRWRTAALNTADLWTHIDDTIRERMLAFAQRSSPLPVFAALHSGATYIDPSLAPRLRRLDINHSQCTLWELERSGLPSLEVLTVIFPRVYPFHYGAPSLKAIRATGSNQSWSLGPFPSLTHLHLDTLLSSGEYIRDFVLFLSSNPTIEAIYMIDNRPHRSPSRAPAFLPRLRTFWITCRRVDAAGVFLSHFSFPASARILMHSRERWRSAGYNFNTSALLALPGRWRLSLIVREDGNVLVCADGVAPGGARLQLLYKDSTDVADWWAHALSIARIETLRIAIPRWDSLVPLVARAQRLRTLALAGANPDAVAVLSSMTLPDTLETLSIQGAGLLDAAEADVRGLLARLGPGVSVVLDPGCGEDDRTQEWLTRLGGLPNVTAAVGEGLCRWGPEEAFWEADRGLQTRYFDIPPQVDPGIEFVW